MTAAAGAEFEGFYGFADNSGGVAIIEVDSHQTPARTITAHIPWIRFAATPLLPIEESAQIGGEGVAFRASAQKRGFRRSALTWRPSMLGCCVVDD